MRVAGRNGSRVGGVPVLREDLFYLTREIAREEAAHVERQKGEQKLHPRRGARRRKPERREG